MGDLRNTVLKNKGISLLKANTTLMLHLPPKIVKATRKTIEKLGHQALVVRRSDEAIRLAKQHAVELFVFRIENPARDCELFRRIQKTQPDCEGIALISSKLRSDFPLFHAHTYPDHLIPDKTPTEFSDLETTLKKVIGGDIFGMERYGIKAHEKSFLTGR